MSSPGPTTSRSTGRSWWSPTTRSAARSSRSRRSRAAGRCCCPDEDVDQTPAQWLDEHPLEAADAFVMCDHDTPGMEALLRQALAGRAGYVAMMGSRRRAERVFDALDAELDAGDAGPAARPGRAEHRRQGTRRDRAVRGRRGRRGLPRPARRPDEGTLGPAQPRARPGSTVTRPGSTFSWGGRWPRWRSGRSGPSRGRAARRPGSARSRRRSPRSAARGTTPRSTP